MSRINLGVACMLTAMLVTTAADARAASGKVPGLHVYSTPSFSGPHTRVPHVVRGFNPRQHIMGPKKDIGLARRR